MNEMSEDIKIIYIAIYFQTSSFRRTAKTLSEFHKVSYNAVRRWIKKIREGYPTAVGKKRNLVAIDETVVKVNKECYYVYSAVDDERNESILMKVYTRRSWLTTKILREVPWRKRALESLNLEFEHEEFRGKKLS